MGRYILKPTMEYTMYKLPAADVKKAFHWKDFGLLLTIEEWSPYLSYHMYRLEEEFVEAEDYEYANVCFQWRVKHGETYEIE